MRVARLLLPITILLFAASAAPASASTPIGQLLTPYNGATCAGNAVVQTAVETGTNPYAVPAGGGVITSWQTRTANQSGTMKIKVFRPTGVPGEYITVGEEGPHNVAANTSPTFSAGVRIPVQAGDLLGGLGLSLNCNSEYMATKLGYKSQVFGMGVDPPPGSPGTIFSNGSGYAFEMLANVEPDTDLDGYGDETQDACPGNELSHALPCAEKPVPPVVVPPPAPDVKAPQVVLTGKLKQDALKAKAVVATVSADEDFTFAASGSVTVPGAGAFSLTPASGAGLANAKTGLSLGISKKVGKKIASALKNGKIVKASVHIVAKDTAGNPANATLPGVTIKRATPKKHK